MAAIYAAAIMVVLLVGFTLSGCSSAGTSVEPRQLSRDELPDTLTIKMDRPEAAKLITIARDLKYFEITDIGALDEAEKYCDGVGRRIGFAADESHAAGIAIYKDGQGNSGPIYECYFTAHIPEKLLRQVAAMIGRTLWEYKPATYEATFGKGQTS